MNSYINNLLSYKNNLYNDKAKENFDKKHTEKYLDSCLVFIYDKTNKNITPFLKEMENFVEKQEENSEKKQKQLEEGTILLRRKSLIIDASQNKSKDKSKFEFKNILVKTSDICGLGKSEKIKKIIKDEKKI